eukprot:6858283-Alexandrium_andersonii.AAC.1
MCIRDRFCRVDCELRRIAALTGLEQIAECTLVTAHCTDPRTCGVASGIRSLNCAAPGTASEWAPGAPEGCDLQ